MSVYQSSLVSTAPFLQHNDPLVQQTLESITKETPFQIGFVSSFFTPNLNIWGSFGKTVHGLQSNLFFTVDMIYYPRSPISEADMALPLNPEKNLYLSQFSLAHNDPNRQPARAEIVDWCCNILVYLDLWMAIQMNKLAVEKLALIQMATHGRPVTSEIPSYIMDYFISWSAAKLDPKIAQAFYTEELILLPGDHLWEHYEPRTTNGSSNVANSADFSHYNRESLANTVLAHDNEAAALIQDPGLVLYFSHRLHLSCTLHSIPSHPRFKS